MVNVGVTLPAIVARNNGACVELIRGTQLSEGAQRKPGGLLGGACSSYKSGESGEQPDDDLLQELNSQLSVHNSYVVSASGSAADKSCSGSTTMLV